jgi:hypothetical protein
MRIIVNRSRYYGLPLQPISSLAEKDAEMALRSATRTERRMPGPILGAPGHQVTYQSHTITLVTYTTKAARTGDDYHSYVMHMQHGGGEETFDVYPNETEKVVLAAILPLDDVTVYSYFYTLYTATTKCYYAGRDFEHAAMVRAAAEGRLKVNKVRNRDAYRVTVKPPNGETGPLLSF